MCNFILTLFSNASHTSLAIILAEAKSAVPPFLATLSDSPVSHRYNAKPSRIGYLLELIYELINEIAQDYKSVLH